MKAYQIKIYTTSTNSAGIPYLVTSCYPIDEDGNYSENVVNINIWNWKGVVNKEKVFVADLTMASNGAFLHVDYKKVQFMTIEQFIQIAKGEISIIKSKFDDLKWNETIDGLCKHFKYDYLRDFFKEKAKELGEDYKELAAARIHHHNYIGGLWEHTYEMLASLLALMNTGLYGQIIADYVAIAVLYHDYAKKFEYKTKLSPTGKTFIDTTHYMTYVGHLYGSAHLLENDLAAIKMCTEEQRFLILHCVLAHHGRVEWGAVKEPQTMEAKMTHQLDMLSSQCAMNEL